MDGLATESRIASAAVGLVVPCYNEAGRMSRWEFLRFARENPWLHYYFVDDGSTDTTYRTLAQMRQTLPLSITVLRLHQNRGKAEAVRHGLLAASAEPHELVGFWDADLAAPLSELPQMRDVLIRNEQMRLVVGVRRRILGRRIRRKRIRGLLGGGFSWVASRVLRMPRCDTQCGAKLFRNDGCLRAVLQRPFQSRWIFDVELLARYRATLGKARLLESIYEYPLEEWSDVAGSKLRWSDFGRAVFELLRLALADHRCPVVDTSESCHEEAA